MQFATRNCILALLVTCAAAFIAPSAQAATQTWDATGDGTTFDAAANWSNDTLPSVSATDTALFNGLVAGSLSLNYAGTGFAGAAGNGGITLSLSSLQTGSVAIDSGANLGALRLAGITIAGGAGAFTLGNGSGTFNVTMGGAAGTQTFSNDSTNVATINSDVVLGTGGGGAHTFLLTGTGNWILNNTVTNSSGTVSLSKTGIGTATLNAANTFTGATTISGGALQLGNANAVQNSAVTISTTNGLTFSTGIGTFNVGGLAGASDEALTDTGSNAVTLVVGSNTGTYSGALSGAGALTKTGVGAATTLTLTGANTYTGATTITSGTLDLGGSTANGSISSSSILTLGGGALNYTRTGNTTQTFASTTVNSGASIINAVAGDTLALGAITHNVGGAVNFGTTGAITTTSTNTNGILGGWATVGNSGASTATADFVAVTSGTIGTYSGYTAVTGVTAPVATQNWNNTAQAATTQVNVSGTINSLKQGADFSVGSGATLTVGSGGIIMSGISRWLLNNNTGSTAGTGAITSGLSSGELFVDVADAQYNNNTGDATNWRIWTNIINGANPTKLVKTGPGALTLMYGSTYTGGTIVDSGILGSRLSTTGAAGSVTAGPIGTGSLTINQGAAYEMHLQGSTGSVGGTLLTLANAVVLNGGALWSLDGYSHVTGNVTVNSAGGFIGSTYNGASGAYTGSGTTGQSKGVFVDGVVSGSGNLVLEQAGVGGNGAIAEASAGNNNTLNNNFNQSIVMFTNNSNTYSGTVNIAGSGSTSNTNYLGVNGNTVLQFATVNATGTNGVGSAAWGASPVLFETAGTASVVGDSFTFGALSGSSPITLTEINEGNLAAGNSVALTVGGNNASTTYSGIMSGGGSLTKTGTGTMTLSGANTYTGATTVSGGTLQMNTTNATSASVTVNNGGTLALNVADALGFTTGKNVPTINSGGTITNMGSGTRVTLWNGLTMTGGTLTGSATVTDGLGEYSLSGTVAATSDASGNAATISGTPISFQNQNVANGVVTFNVTRGSATPASDLNVSARLIANPAIANIGLTKTGNGIMTLTGSNSYSGATAVQQGTLVLGTGGVLLSNTMTLGSGGTSGLFQLGDSSGAVNTTVTSLTTSGSGTANAVVGGNASVSTLTVNNAGAVTYGGALGGAGTNQNNLALAKTGAGTLTLTGSSSHTGATNLNVGTIVIDHSGANTGALGNTAVTGSAGTTLLVKGNTNIGNGAGGTLTSSGTVSLADTTVNTLTIGGGITLNAATLGLDIGTGTIDLISAGGAATLAGTSTVNLSLLTGNALQSGTYTFLSATGGISGSNFTLGTKPTGFYQFSFADSTSTAANLTISGNATPAIAYWTGLGSGSSGDSLNKWGSGSTVNVSNWSTTADGLTDPLQVPGATTDTIFTAANAVGVSGTLNTQLDGGYQIKSLTFDVPAGTGITSTVINTNGNTLTTGSGGVTLAATSNSSATISGTGAVTVNGSQNWANNSNSNALTVSTGITALSGATTLTLNGTGTGGVTLSGVIGNGTGTLGVVLNQAGLTQLNATNTFTGGVTINTGTVRLGATNALGTVNALTFGGAADLQLNGNNTTVAGINGSTSGVTIESAAIASGTATLTDNTTGTDTFNGVLQNGSGSGVLALTKSGTGSLTLTNANTYSGVTTISGGTLKISAANNIGDSSATNTIALSGGGTLETTASGFDLGANRNVTLTGAGTIQNDAGTLTVSGTVNTGANLLTVAGAGNTTISQATGATGASLLKTGSGTLTLSNGSTWTGVAANGNIPSNAFFPMVVREGTLLLAGGTNTVTGELVIGGVVAHGGAGQNAKIQIDAGALNISTWLSIGRGNGVGAVSSDLVINNNASVTSGQFSGGYNGDSGLNLPKGSFTLNNTSSYTLNSGGAFNFAESAGSNYTMTLNDSSSVSLLGNATRFIGQNGSGTLNINGSSSFTNASTGLTYIGYRSGAGTVNLNGGTFNNASSEVRVGGSDLNGTGVNGTGTLNITSGTATVGTLVVARGNNNQNTVTGTVNVSGGTLTSAGDVVLGYAGAGNLGYLNITGGTVNVGTTTAKTLMLQEFDTARGQVDISSGNLNLNTNSSIKFSTGNTASAGTNVFNQNGGNVSFYSDNATTIGGTGVLDMAQSGAATASNTYNLNGGILTVPQIISTGTLPSRTFNFNGGTLKAAVTSGTFMNLGTGGTARANVRNGGAIIDTNSNNVTVAQALLHSNIGGDNATDGGLTKNSAGTLTLTNAASTFTGDVNVNGGTLAVNASNNVDNPTNSALGNPLIARNINVNNGSTLQFLGPDSLGSALTSSSATLVINAGATVTNGGTTFNTLGPIQLNGGTLTGQGGSGNNAYQMYNLRGTVTVGGTSMSTITASSGTVGGGTSATTNGYHLAAPTTFNVADVTAGTDLLVAATLIDQDGSHASAAGALTKTGNGTMLLTGNNTYTGATIISNGTLQLGDGTSGHDGTIAGTSGVTDNATLAFNRFGTVSSAYSISGTGAVTVNGAGTQVLTGVSSYSGATTITSGATLQLGDGTAGHDGSIGSTSGVTDNGTLAFNRSGTVSSSYVITGTGALTMNGSGTQVLTGNSNGFTGTTTVNSGTIIVAGSLAGSTTTVNNGGTLGGTGSVGALTVSSGGTLSPSVNNTATVGNLTASSFTESAGAHLSLQINDTTAGDKITTTANNGLSLSGDATFSFASGYAPTGSDVLYVILNNGNGAVNGAFSGITIVDNSGTNTYGGTEGTLVSINGQSFNLTYAASGDSSAGNDIALQAVPEPATWAMLFGGMGMLAVWQRSRRRKA